MEMALLELVLALIFTGCNIVRSSNSVGFDSILAETLNDIASHDI